MPNKHQGITLKSALILVLMTPSHLGCMPQAGGRCCTPTSSAPSPAAARNLNDDTSIIATASTADVDIIATLRVLEGVGQRNHLQTRRSYAKISGRSSFRNSYSRRPKTSTSTSAPSQPRKAQGRQELASATRKKLEPEARLSASSPAAARRLNVDITVSFPCPNPQRHHQRDGVYVRNG